MRPSASCAWVLAWFALLVVAAASCGNGGATISSSDAGADGASDASVDGGDGAPSGPFALLYALQSVGEGGDAPTTVVASAPTAASAVVMTVNLGKGSSIAPSAYTISGINLQLAGATFDDQGPVLTGMLDRVPILAALGSDGSFRWQETVTELGGVTSLFARSIGPIAFGNGDGRLVLAIQQTADVNVGCAELLWVNANDGSLSSARRVTPPAQGDCAITGMLPLVDGDTAVVGTAETPDNRGTFVARISPTTGIVWQSLVPTQIPSGSSIAFLGGDLLLASAFDGTLLRVDSSTGAVKSATSTKLDALSLATSADGSFAVSFGLDALTAVGSAGSGLSAMWSTTFGALGLYLGVETSNGGSASLVTGAPGGFAAARAASVQDGYVRFAGVDASGHSSTCPSNAPTSPSFPASQPPTKVVTPTFTAPAITATLTPKPASLARSDYTGTMPTTLCTQ